MPTDLYEQQIKAYKEDSRYACQFGIKCYQKNPAHHSRYKHPPKREQDVPKKAEEPIVTGKKRPSCDREDAATGSSDLPQTKLRKEDEASKVAAAAHDLSPSPPPKDTTKDSSSESESESESPEPSVDKVSSTVAESKTSIENGDTPATSAETENTDATNEEKKTEIDQDSGGSDQASTDPKKIIQDLFLVKMPEDFYKFYDFCTLLRNTQQIADLKLVGPFDVLGGKITTNRQDEPEKFLRHWRYYYDPPEFQTILQSSEKEGLHYGYWRDDAKDLPVFVGKNNANDCNIVAVAPNIFAAVASHLDERRKTASPFVAVSLDKITKRLKAFAAENGISLSKDSPEMRNRERKVVAKTFHGAGIVVPYDKKTQLGYRDLAATDSQLRKILKKIDEAETDEERKVAMSGIEEVIRLATIAADECDFGTCLELGHDLFSSGIERVQKMGLQMLATAYNLLHREQFLKIAQAHAKDRKKGCDLSVL